LEDLLHLDANSRQSAAQIVRGLTV
jgi:hypothetical protein